MKLSHIIISGIKGFVTDLSSGIGREVMIVKYKGSKKEIVTSARLLSFSMLDAEKHPTSKRWVQHPTLKSWGQGYIATTACNFSVNARVSYEEAQKVKSIIPRMVLIPLCIMHLALDGRRLQAATSSCVCPSSLIPCCASD